MPRFTLSIAVTALFLFTHSFSAWSAHVALPFFDKKEMTPYWEPSGSETPAAVTEFQALNQDGRVVNEKNMKNEISLVNFFFAECPMLCPIMMTSMKRFQNKLGDLRKDVKIYS